MLHPYFINCMEKKIFEALEPMTYFSKGAHYVGTVTQDGDGIEFVADDNGQANYVDYKPFKYFKEVEASEDDIAVYQEFEALFFADDQDKKITTLPWE